MITLLEVDVFLISAALRARCFVMRRYMRCHYYDDLLMLHAATIAATLILPRRYAAR